MAGYCSGHVSSVQWFSWVLGEVGFTEVVATPQSSTVSRVGVGALGVSMNSYSDSLPFTLCDFDMVNQYLPTCFREYHG
jgi:hypothetical protein